MASTAIRAQSSVARPFPTALWWRIARVLTLLVVGGMVVALEIQPISWVQTHFFSLLYAYVVFALWLGDAWESFGAIASSWVVAGALVLTYDQPHLVVGDYWGFAGQGGPSGYNTRSDDTVAWLVFVVSSLALVGVTARLRRKQARMIGDVAAPVAPANLQDPVLIIRGHAQILQHGTGVVFDTRGSRGTATTEVAGVRVARGGDGAE